MQTEYSALQDNETWELVPRPHDHPVIRCMWLFRHKFKSDGTLERYKARLVVNGNSQTVGVDCDETFSPVVKPATIRTVLSLAVSRAWSIHQLDVKNAFLHGELNETVFMHQPPGFYDKRFPDHVCRLKKSLYGLKQAPRAWYTRFENFITSKGFRSSTCDQSLFVYHQDASNIAYLLLYVDDIVLTASNDRLLNDIIGTLSREFAMTDLGRLHHFLGIKVTQQKHGIFLSQAQYAKDIIARASMSSCKPCATPVDLSSKLSANDGPLFSDPTLYRSLAGALQYLTFTRPDLSYAVQQVCLFMHEPREPHFAFMKRMIRYLQGTIDYGLRIVKSGSHNLVAYSDADWGGCPDSRRSTSGYCVFLGDNLISWSAKRQPTVSRSSAEAEYRGVANAVAEISWIRNLLLELHTPLQRASVVFCDNVSAVYLSNNPVQHQRTKHIEIDIHFVREKVFDIFLKWSDGLKSGALSFEDLELLKRNLEEKKTKVLPTAQDKWVSLHSSFGLVMLEVKISFLMTNLGIPALSEVVTREAICNKPVDNSYETSLVSWVLPYAQRYISNSYRERYLQLKLAGFEKDEILFVTRNSDSHSIFMELSRFLVNGDPDLHLANFLHMITCMNESGSTEKQIESFILNSQKVPKLSDEEPVWSIQSMGVMPLNTVTSATKGVPKRSVRPSSSSQSNRRSWWNNTVNSVDAEHGLVDQDGFLGHGGTNAVDTIIVEHDLVDQDGSSGFSQKDQLSHGSVNVKHASLTGRRGEELAFNYYKNMGIKAVKWVNECSETGLPYDIEVCDDENRKEYIEVKTTDSKTKDWFEISVREWQFAVKKGDSFSIARFVLLGDKRARVTVFKNPARLCQLGQLKLAVLMSEKQKDEFVLC
ncbi:putative RNA-directed DNA polymerase [Helianthus annuus]|nr:putative RNA-directed DNA polymerase [Helianthus annuus]KAJ0874282.1 putative RNA-directed DNA polymerase [Helianthus annuus]